MQTETKFPAFAAFLLFALFILFDVREVYSLSNYVKFAFMCAVFIISVLNRDIFITLGMMLTVVCDYFLLFTRDVVAGVSLFCLVHIIYTFYNSEKKLTAALILAASLPAIYVLNATVLPDVILFYAVCFILDIFSAFKYAAGRRPLFCAGLVLFALCDICVAFYNLTSSNTAFFFIWVFYAPSQFLIAQSPSRQKQPRCKLRFHRPRRKRPL